MPKYKKGKAKHYNAKLRLLVQDVAEAVYSHCSHKYPNNTNSIFFQKINHIFAGLGSVHDLDGKGTIDFRVKKGRVQSKDLKAMEQKFYGVMYAEI